MKVRTKVVHRFEVKKKTNISGHARDQGKFHDEVRPKQLAKAEAIRLHKGNQRESYRMKAFYVQK